MVPFALARFGKYGSVTLLILIGLFVFTIEESKVFHLPVDAEPLFTPQDEPLLIAQQAFGEAIVAGDYLFWRDMRTDSMALYGYHVPTSEEFLIHQFERPADMVQYASDGSTLAWIDTRTPLDRVIGFDLETRQEFLIHEATAARSRLSAIAVDEQMVYYTDTNRAQPGLYAYHLLTQATQQLAPGGQRVAAADGVVAWFDQQQPPYGPHTLTILERDTQQQTTVTAQRGTPTGLSLSAGTIIWSFFPDGDDGRVFAYDTTTAISQPLSTGGGWYPVINGPWTAWTTTESAPATITHTITVLNQATGQSAPLVTESAGPLRTCGISADGRVLFLVHTPGAATARLYLSHPGTSGLQYSQVDDSGERSAVPAQGADNYIYTSIRDFRINRPDGSIETWPVHGVQFFLPDYDINNETFSNGAFATHGPVNGMGGGDGEFSFWLQKAGDLQARSVRIFAGVPGENFNGDGNNIQPANIYAFAKEAQRYGLRVGIVIHNSTDFTMTPAKEQWIRDLIRAFGTEAYLIAYINAGNEINIRCQTGNCYAEESGYGMRANNWVSSVAAIVRDEDPNILVTVGMGTEVDGYSIEELLAPYVQEYGNITLSEKVDFLSPHNYGGGGFAIWGYLSNQYNGPIVLEEYGYTTDPFISILDPDLNGNEQTDRQRERPDDPAFLEECFRDPWVGGTEGVKAVCDGTAIEFIEINTRAIQETSIAGGVAFMLADTKLEGRDNFDHPDDCSEETATEDYFTGLYATNGYCGSENPPGGTVVTSYGFLKGTGYRVCLHHTNNNPAAGECQLVIEPYRVLLPLVRR